MTNPVTGNPIEYYEIEIKEFTQQVYPNKGLAKLVGYDGISPGPTFHIERGTESVVRFINNAKTASSIHLHGSYSVCHTRLLPVLIMTYARMHAKSTYRLT